MKTEPGLSSEFRAGALITISFIALLAMLFTVGSSQLFSKTKKISLVKIVNNLDRNKILLLLIVKSTFLRIIKIFSSLESNVEKEIKKIEKNNN